MKLSLFSLLISVLLISFMSWINFQLVEKFHEINSNTLEPFLISIGKNIKICAAAISLAALIISIISLRKKEKLNTIAIIIALIRLFFALFPIWILFVNL